MDTDSPIIELRRLTKSFGSHRVLDDVDLSIERGRCTVIIGRSGTGKSVLLKHIVGLLRPDRGEVFFEGTRIDQLNERALAPIRRQISFVFQLNALFDSMSVGDNVAFPLRESPFVHLKRAEVARRANESLERVGLSGFASKHPGDLSGGEKKRVALARAICTEPAPKVILYDEPTAGLDPQRADVINHLIRQLQTDVGVTSIVVSHDMNSVNAVGDRALMLHQGRIVADAPPSQLSDSTLGLVRRFVKGEAEANDYR